MGGIDIEEVAEKHPEHVSRTHFSTLVPFSPYIAKQAIAATGVTGDDLNKLTPIVATLIEIFLKYDLTLAEINPLGKTEDGKFLVLDGHIDMEGDARDKYAPPAYREGAVLPGRSDLIPFVLDRKAGTARPKEKLSGKVSLSFPVSPMLGCIGVASDIDKPPTSGPAGTYGGNLDYKEVREGATVMLPVSLPGAYFFLGDGHALEGDGEAVGSGIETSLDVEFRIELKKRANLTGPRLENAEYLISVGGRTAQSNSLNEALATANADMLRWLIEERGIEPVAAHLLIGHQGRYDVVTLAGVMAVKIPKNALRE